MQRLKQDTCSINRHFHNPLFQKFQVCVCVCIKKWNDLKLVFSASSIKNASTPSVSEFW